MAVSTIICRQNLEELPRLWCWLRDRGIAPYFEIITPQANALENSWLEVDSTDLQVLFHRLAAIDRERYGRTWDVQPPLVGNRCRIEHTVVEDTTIADGTVIEPFSHIKG